MGAETGLALVDKHVHHFHLINKCGVRDQYMARLAGPVAREHGCNDRYCPVNGNDGRGGIVQTARRSWKGFTVESSPSNTIR